ncbi:hypothetical protein D3C72_2389260 [compost metagenome]
MRIRSRALGASYDEADGPDAYDLLGFGAFLRKISRWFAKTIKLPIVTQLAEKVYDTSWVFDK